MCVEEELFDAVRRVSIETVKTLVQKDTNPFCQLQRHRPSEMVKQWLTRSWRMGHPDPQKMHQVMTIQKYLLYAEKRWHCMFIRKRFLRRWCRWHRRNVQIKEACRAKRVLCIKTKLDEELGPSQIISSMLHPDQMCRI